MKIDLKIKNSKIHGKGLFTNSKIKKGQKIIQYIGEIITKKESGERCEKMFLKNKNFGVYIFELDNKFDLDGNVKENTARFINHSCDPNCKYQIKKHEIWIVALRDIKKGEELTYDYMFDLDNYRENKCNCKAKNCSGYIVAKNLRKKVK